LKAWEQAYTCTKNHSQALPARKRKMERKGESLVLQATKSWAGPGDEATKNQD